MAFVSSSKWLVNIKQISKTDAAYPTSRLISLRSLNNAKQNMTPSKVKKLSHPSRALNFFGLIACFLITLLPVTMLTELRGG
jgi:hypothetical protein